MNRRGSMKLETLGLVSILLSFAFFAITLGIFLWILPQDLATRVRIDAGDNLSHSFTTTRHSGGFAFKVDVVSGPRVDVYIFTSSDYNRYLQGARPVDDDSLVYEDRHYTRNSVRVPAGTYWFVIDNSDYGIADPQSHDVVVEFEFPLEQPPRRFEVLYLGLTEGALLFLTGITLSVLPHNRRSSSGV